MSVFSPEAGEVFSVRTFKVYEGYRWANTYEIQAQNATTISRLRDAAFEIANVERAPIPSVFRVYKVTISTYVPDDTPYNPETFTTLNVDLPGQAGLTPELLPLGICVFVRKNVEVGRPGKAFYRGFLSEGNVSWGGDRFTISDQRVNQLANALNSMLAALLALGFRMVLASGRPSPTNVRQVNGLIVTNRTSMKKLDNRYFDVRNN